MFGISLCVSAGYSDGMSFDSTVHDVTAGGECVDGLKMEISINSGRENIHTYDC